MLTSLFVYYMYLYKKYFVDYTENKHDLCHEAVSAKMINQFSQ